MKKTVPTIVMAMLCLIFTTKAQQTTSLTGKVITSPDSRPLSGATIKVENGGGVLSNSEGKFTIQTSLLKGLLIISYTGFKTVKVPFSKDAPGPFSIILQEVESTLKEIEVNAGYYTVKDKDRTGSISSVSGETIAQQPVSNPLAALIGRMAGVNIEQQSGINGGGFKVEIRGRNSLRSTAREPLYLIDGVPYPSTGLTDPNLGISGISEIGSPLNYLSPNDIESIEVLKDADATAIYGSRGANGVVLIKTKSATVGRTAVDVSMFHGISKRVSKVKLLNTPQYLEMRHEAFANDKVAPALTDYDVNGTWSENRYTDWQEVLTGGNAKNTNMKIGVNGGNEYSQFSFRGNYSKQGSVFPGEFADQKVSGALVVNHTSLNKKFKVNFSSTCAIDHNTLPQTDLSSFFSLAPNAPDLYDNKGNLNWALDDSGSPTWSNPLASLLNTYKAKSNSFLSSALFNYEVLSGLSLKSSLGYTNIRLKENLLNPISAQSPSEYAIGIHQISYNTLETWIIEPQVNYQKNIGNGVLDILIGGTFQKDDQKMEAIAGVGYTSDLLLESITAAPIKNASSASSEYNYNALFGRVNYNYQGKYLVNLTGRRDGSSRFGPGKQFANFGAIGMAWIFSEENLFKNAISALSFGKIRTSYGVTGSDQIPNYGYLNTYSASQPYVDGSGLVPNRLANPNYSWETNKKLETALELGFVDNRILFSSSWYRNRSSNQLVGYSLPDITGFSSILDNLPATVQNSGWEFELNTQNIKNRLLTWSSSVVLTIPKNKLLAFPNLSGSSYARSYTVGSSLYAPIGYHYLYVNPQSGVYTFQDLNGNGSDLDEGDKKVANRALTSQFYGGLHNSLTYKNFQLEVFFQFTKKTARNPLYLFDAAGAMGNQPLMVLERWKNPGDVTEVQKFSQSYEAGGAAQRFGFLVSSDRFTDASFIRLKNVSLSWNAPNSLIQKLKLSNLKVCMQAQNLFTITNYLTDPEVLAFRTLPALTTVTIGIQASF